MLTLTVHQLSYTRNAAFSSLKLAFAYFSIAEFILKWYSSQSRAQVEGSIASPSTSKLQAGCILAYSIG